MNYNFCCRTCLSQDDLHPIFVEANEAETYTTIINSVTGIVITINDDISKNICTNCVNFINKSVEFRNNCLKSNRMLLENVSQIKACDVIENYGKHIDRDNVYIAIGNVVYYNEDCVKEEDSNRSSLDDNQDAMEDANPPSDDKEQEIDVVKKERRKYCKVKKVRIKKIRNNKFDSRAVKKEMKTVLREDDDDTQKEGNKSEENIECEVCHKSIKTNGYKNHLKRHTGFDIVCEHCGKAFVSRRKLLAHCKAKHGYEKTDKCSFCDYRASNIELVKIHERLHTGEKPYICKECGAGFHRNSNYLQHLPIHLPEKTVQCDQCPAMFKSITLMRIHKNTRHKVCKYQYRCSMCKNTFVRRYNVVKHLRRIHGCAARDEGAAVERIKIAS